MQKKYSNIDGESSCLPDNNNIDFGKSKWKSYGCKTRRYMRLNVESN